MATALEALGVLSHGVSGQRGSDVMNMSHLRRLVAAHLPVPRPSHGTYRFPGGTAYEGGGTEVRVELDDGRKAYLLLCAAGFDRWEA